jgi:hypothetical protein
VRCARFLISYREIMVMARGMCDVLFQEKRDANDRRHNRNSRTPDMQCEELGRILGVSKNPAYDAVKRVISHRFALGVAFAS